MSVSLRRPTLGMVGASLLAVVSLTACGDGQSSGSSAKPSGKTGGQDSGAAGMPLPEVKADPAVEALVPDALKQRGTLVVATDPTYAPVIFKDRSGDIVGIDPDFAAAAAAKMGLKLKFSVVPFDGILAGIKAKRFDVGWSGFSITGEREQQVNMVSYLDAATQVLVKEGNPARIDTAEDLCGRTVAVMTGTTQALKVVPEVQKICADADKPKVKELRMPQQDNINQAVALGRADAQLADAVLVVYQAQKQPDLFESRPITFQPGPLGVTLPRERDALAKALQAAVNSMMEDGTYDAIIEKWGLEDVAIKRSEINPAVSS